MPKATFELTEQEHETAMTWMAQHKRELSPSSAALRQAIESEEGRTRISQAMSGYMRRRLQVTQRFSEPIQQIEQKPKFQDWPDWPVWCRVGEIVYYKPENYKGYQIIKISDGFITFQDLEDLTRMTCLFFIPSSHVKLYKPLELADWFTKIPPTRWEKIMRV